jgi:hypothetical protein
MATHQQSHGDDDTNGTISAIGDQLVAMVIHRRSNGDIVNNSDPLVTMVMPMESV